MRGILWYTGLRVALLVAVWLLIQVLTPLRGLIAAGIAVVISGVISMIALDRPRDRASSGIWGIFRRIDERIERSRTAEDVDEPVPSGDADAEAQHDPVGEDKEPRRLEDRDQIAPDGSP